MIIPHTVEEFSLVDDELRLSTPDGIVDGIECDLHVDYEPGQRGIFTGPPERCQEEIPSSASITQVDLSQVLFVDEDGTQVKATHAKHLCDLVAAWLWAYWADDQDEWLCEAVEEERQAQWEAAQEARAEARREELLYERARG